MKARSRWFAAAAAVASVVTATVAYSGSQSEQPTTGEADPQTSTAKVTRGDLVVSETLDGTLGYASTSTASSKEGGTVTKVAPEGSVVARGEALFEVDRRAVFLMYGRLPVYRTMTVGTRGRDVRQLERNLKALGYGEGLEVDDNFTSYTAKQVRRWQEDNGLAATGEVELGRVVFATGPVRVAKHEATLGAAIGPHQRVLTISDLRRVVTVDLPVAQRPLARKGAAVTVTLPEGKTVRGKVISIGTVAETKGGEDQGDQAETTFEVTVGLTKPGSAGYLDAAPVKVTFESERRTEVLTVPVNALVAVPSGDYGVVVIDGKSRRTVKVTLGVFADGRVEISAATGDRLSEGMDVEVPAS